MAATWPTTAPSTAAGLRMDSVWPGVTSGASFASVSCTVTEPVTAAKGGVPQQKVGCEAASSSVKLLPAEDS